MNVAARTPVQIAWVSDDLAALEGALSGLLGVKKWVRLPGVHFAPDTCTYRDRPADFVADISLSYLGDLQLELIAPVRGQSLYSDFLRDHGPGLHHICVEVTDSDALATTVATAVEQGARIEAQGVMPGGMTFAYLSGPQAVAGGVPYLEIAYIPEQIRAFFDHIKQEQQ